MVSAAAAASIALQVACATSGTRFNQACELLQSVLIGPPEYDRPITSSFQKVKYAQGIPSMPGAKESLISKRQFMDPHIDQAIALDSPIAHANAIARPELIKALP